MRDAAALARLEALPRTRLAHLPTPLHEAPALRAAWAPEGPGIWLKRDDETGFALGGNKVRKLEMELAPERLRGKTHLVTTGGPQSNHARVTAAAAARLGLRCILVIDGPAGDPPRGNALLHRLFGAEIRMVASREARDRAMERAARDVAAGGGRALVLPLGASTPLGALGYARAAVEVDRQLPPVSDAEEPVPLHVVVAASSCGTLAGLAAGFSLLGRRNVRLLGVSADIARGELLRRAHDLAARALDRLGSRSAVPADMIRATDDEVGRGYGIPTEASRDALRRLARSEGVVLDPVYTAKAAAGLRRWLSAADGPGPADRVIFWHTGGHPALLA